MGIKKRLMTYALWFGIGYVIASCNCDTERCKADKIGESVQYNLEQQVSSAQYADYTILEWRVR